MPVTSLPARTYADALPYLRAPYTASVIRFRIQSVPDSANAPYVIVLFVNSETVMDRFNIVCGSQWTRPEFTVLAHREEKSSNKTTHHVKVRATFTVFGEVFTDTAEASGQTEVQAEFNANARAFKRAARWPGPGQSLYQPTAIKMFRGDGENQLRVFSNDRSKPNIDERAEKYLLRQYEKVLAERIIPVYGQPFDHLQALGGGASTTATVQSSADPAPGTAAPAPAAPAAPVVAAPAPVAQLAAAATSEQQPPPATPAAEPTRQRAASSSETTAIREQARKDGYSDALSEALMRLARENDETPLSTPFAECVKAWIAVLGRGKVPEEKILEAVTFALNNCASRAGAQVKFGQWVSAKAKIPAAKQPAPAPATSVEGDTQPQATADSAEARDGGDPQVEKAAAMRELKEAIDRHEYTERAAARIAALAIGADPDRKIDLAKIAPGTLRCVGELLDAAATLEWSTGKLDEEISRAHNSTQQGTSASRFGAFAIHLINSAEARVEEDALAAAAAGSA